MDYGNVEEKIKKYIDKIRVFFDVKLAILYGSYAKGFAKKDSDIDVAIFINKNDKRGHLNREKLLFKLRRDIDIRIEPNLFYIEEVKHKEKAGFVNEILKTGKILYKSK